MFFWDLFWFRNERNSIPSILLSIAIFARLLAGKSRTLGLIAFISLSRQLFCFQNTTQSLFFWELLFCMFCYSYTGIGRDGIVPKECALSLLRNSVRVVTSYPLLLKPRTFWKHADVFVFPWPSPAKLWLCCVVMYVFYVTPLQILLTWRKCWYWSVSELTKRIGHLYFVSVESQCLVATRVWSDVFLGLQVGDIISLIDMPPSEESLWWKGKKDYEVRVCDTFVQNTTVMLSS